VSWWITAPWPFRWARFGAGLYHFPRLRPWRSFFKIPAEANNVWAFLSGLLTFTPFRSLALGNTPCITQARATWTGAERATSGRCGAGISGIRPREALANRLGLIRSCVVLAPLYCVVVRHRFPRRRRASGNGRSVVLDEPGDFGHGHHHGGDLRLKAIADQLTALMVAGFGRVLSVYVQHQSRSVLGRGRRMGLRTAALQGIRSINFPGCRNGFPATLEFHHIHHLSPRIPNDNSRSATSEPALSTVKPVRCCTCFSTSPFPSLDEQRRRLVATAT